MKTTFCTLVFLLFSAPFLQLNAQPTLFAGPQLTSAQYSIRGVEQKTDSKIGFSAGVGLKTLIEGPVYFTPQLFYSRKGYKVVFDRPAAPPDSGAVNNNTALHAVELAPLVQVNFSRQPSHVFLRFGPSFEVNVSGSESFDSTNGRRANRKMPFSFSDYSFVTLSVNGQLGYQHQSGLTAFAYYNLGVSSLNNSDFGPSIYHRVAGVAVGYRLGKKR